MSRHAPLPTRTQPTVDHCGESPGFPRITHLASLAVAAARYKYFTNGIGCQRRLRKSLCTFISTGSGCLRGSTVDSVSQTVTSAEWCTANEGVYRTIKSGNQVCLFVASTQRTT